jgi:hypothetical protein
LRARFSADIDLWLNFIHVPYFNFGTICFWVVDNLKAKLKQPFDKEQNQSAGVNKVLTN